MRVFCLVSLLFLSSLGFTQIRETPTPKPKSSAPQVQQPNTKASATILLRWMGSNTVLIVLGEAEYTMPPGAAQSITIEANKAITVAVKTPTKTYYPSDFLVAETGLGYLEVDLAENGQKQEPKVKFIYETKQARDLQKTKKSEPAKISENPIVEQKPVQSEVSKPSEPETPVHKNEGGLTQGRIVYVTHNKKPLEKKGSLIESELTFYFKNGKSRSEVTLNNTKTTSFSDFDSKTSVSIFDKKGKQVCSKMNENTYSSFTPKEAKLLNETKVIAGYVCKKATVDFGYGFSSTLYYCTELSYIKTWPGTSVTIKGLPDCFIMESEEYSNNILFKKSTVKNVFFEEVPDELFIPPANIKEATSDDFLHLFD